ncbi:hypothetical protein C8039_09815 [Halogeometricum sp. wsp3]|nr:hypothetical protein C8039_09815 [Halogeometricum sp. wsp3]
MLHDQVSTYQTRLNNGLDKPGRASGDSAAVPDGVGEGVRRNTAALASKTSSQTGTSRCGERRLLGVQRSTFGRGDPRVAVR